MACCCHAYLHPIITGIVAFGTKKLTSLGILFAGFMGTGACLLDKDTDMPCGLIIEKVNGIPCEKRLASEDGTFADVRYLLEMCRQVRHTDHLLAFYTAKHAPSAMVCKRRTSAT